MLIKDFFFRKLVLVTVLLIYLVILAGGIVRSTGSGMGCPDWPHCFGQWVPPTNVSELPPDYKERFKVGNHTIAEFNVFKTWIEYINRLLGVLVGIAVFATFLYSVRFWGTDRGVVLLSLSLLILTGLQGWIGAKVVSSNLSKHMITLHMLIALVIMGIALVLYYKLADPIETTSNNIANYFLVLSGLTFIQILVGTQVRQQIDTIAINHHEANRELWVGELGRFFSIHQILAILVVIANFFASYFLIKVSGLKSFLGKIATAIVALLVVEYGFGVLMARYSIPFYAQPIHLFLATLVFGLQFYAWLVTRQGQSVLVYSVKER